MLFRAVGDGAHALGRDRVLHVEAGIDAAEHQPCSLLVAIDEIVVGEVRVLAEVLADLLTIVAVGGSV